MNWLDIVILIILVLSAIAGLVYGLIKIVFSLVGLILGVALAGRFYVAFSEYLSFIPGDQAPRIVAFVAIFLVVMLVATLIGILLTKLISAVMLGWINRLGGAVLGLLTGAILIAAILAAWVKVANPESIINASKIAPVLLNNLPFIFGLLPGQFDSIRQYF